jgi:hypothetical protein
MWVVRVERNEISCAPAAFRALLGTVEALLDLGFRKTEIAAGEPSLASLARGGIAHWRRAFAFLQPVVRSPLMGLVTMLARRGSDVAA